MKRPVSPITARERFIAIRYVAEDATAQSVASHLALRADTVKTTVRDVRRKYQAQGRYAGSKIALSNRLREDEVAA